MSKPVLLASSSPYRRELLGRLGIACRWLAPDLDETPAPGEHPEQLGRRLAEMKARALASSNPGHLIIGSDQVAALGGNILNKPGDFERAAIQLHASSGKTVTFFTSLALLNSTSGHCQIATDITRVHFRQLNESEIHNYLHKEQPYDCAGSFKIEGMGIALFDKVESDDPTALIGLPLIKLCAMLRAEGISVP